MKTRVDITLKKHDQGMNCAQSVACTYCDLVGVDEQTMFRVTEALGLGMGGMEGTCGAVSGACAVLGALKSGGDISKGNTKAATYPLAKELTTRFLEQNKSLTCKELKGVGTGVVLRKCPDCIQDAARILEDILTRNGIE